MMKYYSLSIAFTKKILKKTLIDVLNPYGNGSAVEKILNILREVATRDFVAKKFYDLKGASQVEKEH